MSFIARIVVGSLGAGACLASALAVATEQTTAVGSWTVAGETVELRHGRAFLEADPFGRGSNPCLLASNQPVPDAALPDDDEGISKLLALMRESGLRALQVCFATDGGKLRDVNDVFAFHPECLARSLRAPGLPSFRARRRSDSGPDRGQADRLGVHDVRRRRLER